MTIQHKYTIVNILLWLLIAFLPAPGSAETGHEEAPPTPHTGAMHTEVEMEKRQMSEGHGEDSHGAGSHGDEHEDSLHHRVEEMARHLPLWSGIPFAGILLSIALLPLFAPHFWHHHFPKVTAFWALLFAIPFLFVYKGLAVYEILHIYLLDYVPFIILLWGLFVTSGGIFLRGALVGTPGLNTSLLAIGILLASWMGTTGASMLMVRPLIRANEFRKKKVHIIIFFIILVSNIGGSLTPLGDPPLFLGFLHGVPFFWTLHLAPQFLFTAGILLIVFYIYDSMMFKKEENRIPEEKMQQMKEWPLRLEGVQNFLFLGGIISLVLVSGTWKPGYFSLYGVHMEYQNVLRDVGILIMGGLSLRFTHWKVREDNHFTWFPIQEVAYLFAGIFVCIIPMLAMLKAGSDGAMGFIIEAVKSPVSYFWVTGGLSSFLDNAPTYLSFFNLSLGQLGLTETQGTGILTGEFVSRMNATYIANLKAISTGAVFFGAMTYIGNAPNFMVRAIAEENEISMPSFFGYIVWSLIILIPVYILVSFLFI